MISFDFDREYFDATATLECGQIFRFRPYKDGYIVFSTDKACYVRSEGHKTVVECEDEEYFRNFFDLSEDYSEICRFAMNCGHEIVRLAADKARGIRILRQDEEEMFYSFIVSQNNMIPRIKGIIERTSAAIGEKRDFCGEEYFSFPKTAAFSKCDEDFFKGLGYGYRSAYMTACSAAIESGEVDLKKLGEADTATLKKSLISMKGVGPKVADCIALFGYHRTDSFPVDTWIEKLYREDFGGTLKDRKKISEYFTGEFGTYGGYVQQYIFYYKRSLAAK